MTDQPTRPPGETPLESWKAIAAYLNREVRTVIRWEQSEGLPVHRHRHFARSTVYAYPSELDRWRANRKPEGKTSDKVQRRPWIRIGMAASVAIVTSLSGGGGRFFSPVVSGLQSVKETVLWTPSDASGGNLGFDSISADGRYLSYLDGNANLVVRDLAAGTVREVTPTADKEKGHPEYSTLSRDGRQIAFAWFTGERYQLRVASLAVAGVPTTRVVLDNPEISYLEPFDWSADGKLIALTATRVDRTTQLALLDTGNGSLRSLTTLGWRNLAQVRFSPDGRYLAFGALPEGSRGQRDVVVMSTDGSALRPVFTGPGHDQVAGWASDGRRLLVKSDKSGSPALWGLTLIDGRPQDDARIVRPDVDADVIGVTKDDAVIVAPAVSRRRLQLATLDAATGRVTEPPVSVLRGENREVADVDFTPDGQQLSYLTARGPGEPVLVLKNLSSGTASEFPIPDVRRFSMASWSADGKSVVGRGVDAKGSQSLYRFELGALTVTKLLPGGCSQPQLSADGLTLYCRRVAGDGFEFIARVLSTGAERVIYRGLSMRATRVSPDDRHFATIEPDQKGNGAAVRLLLVPVAGGEARTLAVATEEEPFGPYLRWSGDSQRLVVTKRQEHKGQTPPRSWHLTEFTLDGKRRILDVGAPNIGSQNAFHPSGTKVAYLQGANRFEVRRIEGLSIK